MKLCKPYREANINQITQGYSSDHKAWDFAYKYGTFIVAMENCTVESIITAENIDQGWELERGYGILLRSIANPEVKYSYWHCQSQFNVKKGDIVLQGQVVAMMGNSGFCMSNGKIVLKEDKLKYPYPGTHLHLSAPKSTLDRIDWNIPIEIDMITVIQGFLRSIINFLKK
jgi:murein DD-endopeptidase MepM/ murein hydrolase activator NlpD